MVADVIQQVIDAFTVNDLDALAELMDTDLSWHAVDARAACHDRDEVLDLMRQQVAAGVRAEVIESRRVGPSVVLGLTVHAPDGVLPDDAPTDAPAYKVITTRAGRVVHIQDCVDRAQAVGLVGER